MKYVDEHGQPLLVEATTSWSFVGAGLRLSIELMGPEYSMSSNTLESGTRVFLSRRLRGMAGEDLVEKQNAVPRDDDRMVGQGWITQCEPLRADRCHARLPVSLDD